MGKTKATTSPQKYVAAAAQVVYSGYGIQWAPIAIKVTMTDYRGFVIYDTFAPISQPVDAYQLMQAGLLPHFQTSIPTLEEVRAKVASLLHDKILVGYALWEFLSVLGLSHPAINTRDTALFLPFRRSLGYNPHHMAPLAILINTFMHRDIGLHGDIPVENARAALDLFRSCQKIWEDMIAAGSWPCDLPPDTHANCFT